MNNLQFCEHEAQILGLKINGDSITPLEEQKKEIINFGTPTKIKEVGQFLGKAGWFRNFIKDFSTKTIRLTSSLRVKNDKDWKYTQNMNNEIQKLKKEIAEIDKMHVLDYDNGIVQRTDASNIGLGAVVMQKNEKNMLVPRQWASKKLTETKKRYEITEKKMLAVLWKMKKIVYELKGRQFTLETDHRALEEIRNKSEFENESVRRWIEKITHFDFKVRYVKG